MFNQQCTIKRFLCAASFALAVPMVNAQPADVPPPPPHSVAADCHHGGPGMNRGPGFHHEQGMFRSLGLTEAQQDKIFNIKHDSAPEMRAKKKSLRQLQEELHKVKHSPDYNASQAKALIRKIADARADIDIAKLETERKVFDVLTAEQKQRVYDRHDKRKDRGQRPGPGPRQ